MVTRYGKGMVMEYGDDRRMVADRRRRSPGGNAGDSLLAQTQSLPVLTGHGRVERGRSPDSVVADDS